MIGVLFSLSTGFISDTRQWFPIRWERDRSQSLSICRFWAKYCEQYLILNSTVWHVTTSQPNNITSKSSYKPLMVIIGHRCSKRKLASFRSKQWCYDSWLWNNQRSCFLLSVKQFGRIFKTKYHNILLQSPVNHIYLY